MEMRTAALAIDSDVAKTLQFMAKEVAADRLRYVAEQLSALAGIIWQPNSCASLCRDPIRARQSDASVFAPAGPCAGDGFAVAVGSHRQR